MPIDISTAKRAAQSAKPTPFPRSVVLSTEDPAAWRQLLLAYMDRFQPADVVESQLVEQMSAAQWRIRRCWSIESSTFDLELTRSEAKVRQTFETIDAPGRTALAHQHLTDNSPALAQIQRQEARLTREYHRALAELRRLQSERPSHPTDPLPVDSAPAEKASLPNEPTEACPEPAPEPNLQNELPSTPEPPLGAPAPHSESSLPPEITTPRRE
ncbi:MAG: hypothetical protein U0Q16_19195 [Bryobacteraceae bacterium]